MLVEFLSKISDRLDRVLRSESFPGSQWMSRESFSMAISQGMVKVDGKIRVKGSFGILAGNLLSLEFPTDRLGLIANPERFEKILYKDDKNSLLFMEKPSGFDTHPLRPWERNTFANFVSATIEKQGFISEHQFEALADFPVLEGGLIQRLDKFTSGVIGVVIDPLAKSEMRQLIAKGKMQKKYQAIVLRKSKIFEFNAPLFFQPRNDGKTIASRESREGSLEAHFGVELIAQCENYQLVEIVLNSGIRHIVRSGLSFLGLPILGDELYGEKNAEMRYFLHASEVCFHWHGREVKVKSPPSTDFVETLGKLGL